jgi:hypothetical protein
MSASTIIQVGPHSEFLRVREIAGYAIFSKARPDGNTTWIIARRPTDPEPPSSVLSEYKTELSAVDALTRWSKDPIPPKMLKRPDEPASGKTNNVSFHGRRGVGPGQLDLQFE